jgi:hypothetical protein
MGHKGYAIIWHLDAGLSWRPVFNLRAVYVGFMMAKVQMAVAQVSPEYRQAHTFCRV